MYTVSPSLPGVGASEMPGAADFFFFFFNTQEGSLFALEIPTLPISVRLWGVGDKNGAIVSIKGISLIRALQ